MQDKNLDKYYEYDLKIVTNERQAEELKSQERQLKQTLENFQHNLIRSFHVLMEIEDELNHRNYGNTSVFSETEQKQKYLLQIIENQSEEQDLQFRIARQELEDEREKLLKERSSLMWD